MSTNEFDKLLNEKFEQHEFAYNRAAWEQLASQLPPDPARRVVAFPWWKVTGVAAALALVVSGAAWYFHAGVGEQVPLAHTGEIAPTHDTEQPDPQPAVEQSVTHKTIQPAGKAKLPGTAKSTILKKQYASDINYTQTDKVQSAEAVTGNAPDVSIAASEPTGGMQATPETFAQPAVMSEGPKNYPLMVADEPMPLPKQRNTFLSLTGGMNYGSMNTGYMAGINARQKLGRKLFVEGDLAVVNNRASQTFTQQQYSQAVAMKTPVEYSDANLVYMSFNPTVGYQVLKNISLGVGADVQRMMNGDDLLVQVDDETERTLPGTDIGLTGKTEVSVSKKLKAGVLYREGINNFLNGGSRFFDRRYLQVQLKFTVFGK